MAPLFGLPPALGATVSNAFGVGYVPDALAFGTVWIFVNVSQYDPLLRALTSAHHRLARRHTGTDTTGARSTA